MMTITLTEAMEQRHSVRQYEEKPLEDEAVKAMEDKIAEINRDGTLHFQLVREEPQSFDCFIAHYAKFSGVRNYIVLAGKKSEDLSVRCGYYGEQLVLLAQQLGLNTCWVGTSYKRIPDAVDILEDEKLVLVITLGYGSVAGNAHKCKELNEISDYKSGDPAWYRKGLLAALLAPTAMNQQKFRFTRNGNEVSVKAGIGLFSKVDLGIVKYHFEIGAGKENFSWKN